MRRTALGSLWPDDMSDSYRTAYAVKPPLACGDAGRFHDVDSRGRCTPASASSGRRPAVDPAV